MTRVIKVKPGHKDLSGQPDHRDHKEIRVTRVQLDLKETRDLSVLQDHRVNKDLKVTKVTRET